MWRTAAGRLARVTLTGTLLLAAAPANAREAAHQVLLLQSVDRGNLPVDEFTGDFRVELDQRAATPVNVVQVVVGRAGSVGPSEDGVIDFIRSTYDGRAKPDLIVSMGGPAAVFVRKYRERLFPTTPLLLASVDQRYLGDKPLQADETAVPVTNDFPAAIDGILQVLPHTRQVAVVTGSGEIGQFWQRALHDAFEASPHRLTLVWLNDLSLQDMLQRCATLPPDSAIFYLTYGTDATGAAYADDRVFADLHARANAPIFASFSVYFGRGIVGGPLMPVEDVARVSADAATRLLAGAVPANLRIAPLRAGMPIFDWRELQRWDIPETRLPVGSDVRYRVPSVWQQHSVALTSAIAVVGFQMFLIAGLLYQRRARRRAENESRRSLALAADASRRQTMSALTSSIGHDLSQPLGSIMSNIQALQMMVHANRATSADIADILSDIHGQGRRATEIVEHHRAMLKTHQLAKTPIGVDAVIDATLTLLAPELTARGVSCAVTRSSSCVVDGDPVLLQQVFVNLIMNAIDAMAETEPDRRQITIACDVTPAGVSVSVCDRGPGLTAEGMDRLFTPFVTTKANGLGIGLTIVRSIVHEHGGTIAVHNRPDGGAMFTVTLRATPAVSPRAVL